MSGVAGRGNAVAPLVVEVGSALGGVRVVFKIYLCAGVTLEADPLPVHAVLARRGSAQPYPAYRTPVSRVEPTALS